MHTLELAARAVALPQGTKTWTRSKSTRRASKNAMREARRHTADDEDSRSLGGLRKYRSH
eukprot:scaffold185211_cov32-Tisochrysis_lutea.AAC.4